MIARELESDCVRCQGAGRVLGKGRTAPTICSCPAGRQVAAPPIRVFFWPHGVVTRAEVLRG